MFVWRRRWRFQARRSLKPGERQMMTLVLLCVHACYWVTASLQLSGFKHWRPLLQGSNSYSPSSLMLRCFQCCLPAAVTSAQHTRRIMIFFISHRAALVGLWLVCSPCFVLSVWLSCFIADFLPPPFHFIRSLSLTRHNIFSSEYLSVIVKVCLEGMSLCSSSASSSSHWVKSINNGIRFWKNL